MRSPLRRPLSSRRDVSLAFTLVELLAVVAIIAILAILALPAYSNYAIRSRFTEVVLATGPTKTAIAACAATGDCVSGDQISLTSGSAIPTAYQYYETVYSTIYHSSLSQAQVDQIADQWVADGFYVWSAPGQPNLWCSAVVGQYGCQGPPVVIVPSASTVPVPCVGTGAGCSPATKYVASVSADSSGVVYGTAVSGSSGLNGETFVLSPAYSAGRVDWTASGTCMTRAGGSLC
jgi:type IV pilus assembly protein PilA